MPIVGLVKRMDFTGLDLSQKIMSNMTYKVPPQRPRSETLDKLVSQGKLGVKTGSGYYEYGGRSTEEIMKERDLKLIKLREFLKEMGEL
jgi:3-hydroxybutyryl-CoA dehydrogenase